MTTPITDVSPACAALWAPYQVTKVPPVDVLEQEHVPAAPPVRNMTNGAVSDADAQRWANASNRDSGWYKWAEANGQVGLLRHLVGDANISSSEVQALSQGAVISLPDCALYPSQNSLFAIGATGQAYFARKHLPTSDSYVLVGLFSGPCGATATFPDGHTQSIPELSNPEEVFQAGQLRLGVPLGDIWFADAGGNCGDLLGPPAEWCGR